MKSLMIVAALCAACCLPAPAQAAMNTMTDVQIYCMFMPMATKCATPAKAAPAKTMAPKPMKTAMVSKPAAAPAPAPAPTMGFKIFTCVPAAKGSAYLLDCSWK